MAGEVARIERVLSDGARAGARAAGRMRRAHARGDRRHRDSTSRSTSARPPRPRSNGVWLRPFRNLIYAMPPYITTDDELAQIAKAMLAAAQA